MSLLQLSFVGLGQQQMNRSRIFDVDFQKSAQIKEWETKKKAKGKKDIFCFIVITNFQNPNKFHAQNFFGEKKNPEKTAYENSMKTQWKMKIGCQNDKQYKILQNHVNFAQLLFVEMLLDLLPAYLFVCIF